MRPNQSATSNDTTRDYPLDRPITTFLEEQTARTPDAPAVVFENTQLTYAELNRRVNRVARCLIDRGATTDSLIGVYMERSVEMVVALLGIVKAGGAYVPLDPEYPRDRVSFMFQDSAIRILLTQRRFEQNDLFAGLDTLFLDDPVLREIGAEDDQNPPLRSSPDSAVYMIYTSGSTGKPKGVVNIHRGLVNRILWMQETFCLTERDRVMQKTPYSFDVSVWEFFWPLITGACIVVAKPGGHRDADYLVNTIVDKGVTTIHFVPSMLSLFLTAERLDRIGSLRLVMSSGEALPAELARRFFSKFPRVGLHNLYGPTEASIDVSHWECTADSTRNVIPIGRPIANTQLWILDESMAQVPVGAEGELYIGGVGLARGYWNRPELTRDRFVSDPFSEDPNARLYKTGDLTRYLPDGAIEYLGRLDFQIKLRGFRIELGEIEALLLKQPGVLSASVVATEGELEERQLIAYWVTDKAHRPALETVRNALRAELPEYMVPARFVLLEEMPLLPNGKVNRNALPKNLPDRPDLSEMYAAPQTPIEKQLCEIWANLLGISRVGIRDSFFDLGGNSIRAVRLAADLRKALRRDIPVVKIFEYPTIAKLADFLSRGEQAQTVLDDVNERATRIRIGRFSGGDSDGIAIIGMAGRFPGAKNLDQLWTNLCGKVESISRFSPDEIDPSVEEEIRNDPNYVPTRGIIDDADKFDARFFGIGPLEAKVMDPQQRVFLELAWAALENAGYDSERFPGMIGVYAGVGDNHYYTNNVLAHPDLCKTVGRIIVGYGNEKDYIATRTSFALNLTGPSVSANTGCSTSLLAVDNAFKALIDFECDMALAGGVDIFVPQKSGQIYKEGGTFTKDGHCRPFDHEATGTMFCDGAGVVILRRLEDAIAAGDRIYAVIRGIAKNNDGANKVSFLAPSVDGQARVIALAQAQAEVRAEDISYVEAHGTGTPLGDPIEIQALTRAFRATTDRKQFCLIGSLKGNIGHPTIASGVAGLIKASLSLYHETIPASLNYSKPNPQIDFEASPFKVVTETIAWPRTTTARRAAVSSFGFGGTNVHAVLEEAPVRPPSGPSRPTQLLLLSAKNEAAIGRLRNEFKSFFSDHPSTNLADAAFTTHVGRRHFAFRQFVVLRDVADAAKALEAAGSAAVSQVVTANPEVVFMFPGQGSQYVNMGRALYESVPAFRERVDACCDLFRGCLDRDLREILFPNAGEEAAVESMLEDTRYAQPALFTLEYALAHHWMELGVSPKALIGHSIGEFVCACIAGAVSLADVVPLVGLRARLMSSMPRGSMLSVRVASSKIVDRLPENIQLAASNAPELCVVAGPTEAIQAFSDKLTAEGLVTRLLHTSHAFHSTMMEPIVNEFTDAVRKVTFSAPKIPIMSTCLADWMTSETIASPQYWARQLRLPVLFADAVAKLVSDPGKVFLEVGPRENLSTLARQQVAPAQRKCMVSTLGSGAKGSDELSALLRSIGNLWINGVAVDWNAYHAGERRYRIPLPTYPFERTSYWVSARPPQTAKASSATNGEADDSMLAGLAQDQNEATTTKQGGSASAGRPTVMDRINLLISTVAGIPTTTIDPTKTFIELGFDSLSLMQMEVVIAREFGVKPTWRQLLEEHRTPLELEALVRASCPEVDALPQQPPIAGEELEASAIQGLTALREAGPKRLFLAYDGEGDVLQYLKLARSMPKEFSLYGMSPMRRPSIPQVHTTVEDMAKHCVSVMRQRQPSGPYMVGGLCAGGVIAFEMARQLERAGERVDWVVLFDAINPQTPFRPFLKTRDRIKSFTAGANPGPAAANPGPAAANPGPAAANPGPAAPNPGPAESAPNAPEAGGVAVRPNGRLQKIRNLVAYEVQNQVDEAWIATRIRILRRLMKKGQQWPEWLEPLREMDIFMSVKGDYKPTAISSDVILIRAMMDGHGPDTPAYHYVKDPLYGWGKLTTGRMEIIDQAGGHVSMLLDEPWYQELAERLSRTMTSKS